MYSGHTFPEQTGTVSSFQFSLFSFQSNRLDIARQIAICSQKTEYKNMKTCDRFLVNSTVLEARLMGTSFPRRAISWLENGAL
jgi:hypothetical protein